MAIKHILFPIDHSDNSRLALQQVKELAQKSGGHVTLLHAYEIYGPTLDAAIYAQFGDEAAYMDDLSQKLQADSSHLLASYKAELEKEGIHTDTLEQTSDPRTAIVRTAEKKSCDLIVMGTRGLGSIKSVLLDSVSNYVVHHSHCPVLLIPGKEG